MILRSPYPDVVAPDLSLPEFLLGGLTPEASVRSAVTDAATGRGYSYGELAFSVDSLATALVRGIGRGDLAALVAPNSSDYPVVFHGVLRAGGVLTPANPLLTSSVTREHASCSSHRADSTASVRRCSSPESRWRRSSYSARPTETPGRCRSADTPTCWPPLRRHHCPTFRATTWPPCRIRHGPPAFPRV